MDVMGGSRRLLIRPSAPAGVAGRPRRARGRSHGSDRSVEEQEPGHWAAGDEHDLGEGNTTLTLLHPAAGAHHRPVGDGEEEEEAIPSIFSLRHPLGAYQGMVMLMLVRLSPCPSTFTYTLLHNLDELKPVAVLAPAATNLPTAPATSTAAAPAPAAMEEDEAGLTSPLPVRVAAQPAAAPVPPSVGAAGASAVLLCDPRERLVHTEVRGFALACPFLLDEWMTQGLGVCC